MSSSVQNPNITVIGGGTGCFTVLTGLREYPVNLSAIITMADDGGSTGILREEFGILPPGDVRRVLVALAHSDNKLLSDLFNYRFSEGGLRGHAFGNIMLTALERMTGSFENAIEEAGKILAVKGSVLPVTHEHVRLCAELEDGLVISGEDNIYHPKHNKETKIKRVYLDRDARANPRAVEAILGADLVVIGPGDFYASVIPNLLVTGIASAIRETKGKKVFVVNLTNKRGATNGFHALDFIQTIEKYLEKKVLDFAVINTKKPGEDRLRQYEEEGAGFVAFPVGCGMQKPIPVLGDFLRRKGFVRHDSAKLAKILVSLL